MISRIFEFTDETKSRPMSGLLEKDSDLQLEQDSQDATLTNNSADAMNNSNETQDRPERRLQHRAGVNLLVKLRPADLKDQDFNEILRTLNASRTNVYVITTSRYYYQSMPLRITFPYSPHDVVTASEDTAKVVRIDQLPGGRWGVALVLQRHVDGAILPASPMSRKAGARAGERRMAVRHPVSATATVTEETSETRLNGRCSDLSVSGCYVDTLNPLPGRSRVNVHLFNEQRSLELTARVITSHVGMGMGLSFESLTSEQMLMLMNWLDNNGADPDLQVGSELISTEISSASEMSGSSDRELILKLIRLLQANGKVGKVDIEDFLSESGSTPPGF